MLFESLFKSRILSIAKYIMVIIVTRIISIMDFYITDCGGISSNYISKIGQWVIYALLLTLLIKEVIGYWKEQMPNDKKHR